GLLVRIAGGERGLPTFAALGAVLGIAYLAKAPLGMGALLFIGAAFALVRDPRIALPRVAVTAVLFLFFASLYVVPLSRAKGRWTLGDSAKLNYAFHMQGVPYVHWQGGPAGRGTPRHPN